MTATEWRARDLPILSFSEISSSTVSSTCDGAETIRYAAIREFPERSRKLLLDRRPVTDSVIAEATQLVDRAPPDSESENWAPLPPLSDRDRPAPNADEMTTLNASKLKLLSGGFPEAEKDDCDSILTEDFVNKFNEIAVQRDDSGIASERSASRFGSNSTSRSRPYPMDAKKSDVVRPANNESLRPTVRPATEEFESNFRTMLFRGPPPLDEGQESSDVATARSNRLRERVGNMFNVPAGRVKLTEDSPSDTDTDYVDKKFQEIMERRKKDAAALGAAQPVPISPKISNLQRSPPHSVFSSSLEKSSLPSQREAPRPVTGVSKSNNSFQDEEYRAEIRLNSLRIKRELEQERRDRVPSPKREPPKVTIGLTPRETLDRKVVELDAMTDSVKRAREEREGLLSDLREMQENLRRNAAEVRLTERWMKENRAKADDVRAELLTAEMRRDNALKEVTRLNEECLLKRSEVMQMEDKLRQRVREIKNLEQQGINRDELDAVIAERNELLQIIRANEETELQKYELEKMLSMAKEDLMSEQQKSREKHIVLEEELDASMSKITELRREKEILRSEASAMSERVKRLEIEISNSEQEKSRLRTDFEHIGQVKAEEFERIRNRMQSDLAEVRQKQSQEETQAQREARSLAEANARLQRETQGANQAAEEFRQQVMQLTQDLAAANDSRSHLLEEAEKKILVVEQEKDEELRNMRENMLADETDKIAELQSQMERERQLALRGAETKFLRDTEDLRTQLKIREDEAEYLKERLRRQELEIQRIQEEIEIEARAKTREVVARERQAWEQAEEKRWRRQLLAIKEDAQRNIETLETTIARQQDALQSQENNVADLRKALDDEQNRTKTITKDRQQAISRVKALAEEEKKLEVERLKDRLARETEAELGRLRVQIQSHKERLDAVRRDKDSQSSREEDLKSIAERIERTVVCEVNEECRKMAEILGIKPRSVDIADFCGQETVSKSSNPITAALANMEACGEEMRSVVVELRSSVDDVRNRLTETLKERDADLEAIRRQLQTEKRKEVVLRGHKIRVEAGTEVARLENLLREKEEEVRSLRRGMSKWKADTAENIATNIQTEFNRIGQRKIKDLQASLLEREREIQRLQADVSKTSSHGRGSPDPNAARLIAHLQDQVKQLRKENLHLHKQGMFRRSGSTGDLTNGHSPDGGTLVRPLSRNSLSRKNVSHV